MEKQDILKFRKLCEILIKGGTYTANKIVIEAGINWPTYKKILEWDIKDIKISASNLGRVQDFIKKHLNDLDYDGITPDVDIDIELGKQIIAASDKQNFDKIFKEMDKISERHDKRSQPEDPGPPKEKSLLPDRKDISFTGMDKLPNDQLTTVFLRVWLEMSARGLLAPVLKESGYSGKLVKEIII
jgi:hypothetical protein